MYFFVNIKQIKKLLWSPESGLMIYFFYTVLKINQIYRGFILMNCTLLLFVLF